MDQVQGQNGPTIALASGFIRNDDNRLQMADWYSPCKTLDGSNERFVPYSLRLMEG